ncbi:MAG: hypothetical protein P4L75_02555 [Clostridia bacterium]|nr:hypothetical protein [Clostridia bacterium]MDR3643778.1 hypothetical protein [Clostridia bacterium]
MKKAKITAIAILVVIFGLIIFFFTPNLNPLYSDGLALWAFAITTVVAVLWLIGKAGEGNFSNVFTADFKGKKAEQKIRFTKRGRVYFVVAAAPWVILIVVNIFSSVIFHVDAYREQMPQPESRKFTSDVQPMDVTQLPIVDYDLASLLADKMLGEKPSLGSQVTLGTPTIEKVNGKLVWVVPLLDSGFFKWFSNLGGTPGYIMVSATNPRDVTYVDKYPIKYQPNAYLLDNLKRHVRLAGSSFTGITDYSFELDDTGKPFWVVTTYKNIAGFSLPEADGVIVVDAGSGATTKYSMSNVPSWIDRVQPTDYISTQLNNRGQYVHGIFNFSNKDKFQTSDGYAIVYNNGKCYYFTGLTSVGSDESATGFVLVDMVTKKPYYYQVSGATEYAAQQSAEGKVQNLKYVASFPLITNVDGEPTYFMTLKDNAGLIKQYAFVSVKDYTTVGTGETIQDALDDFDRNMRSSTGGSVIGTGSNRSQLEGTVVRIASEDQAGTTIYKFTLSEQPGVIFTATYDISEELALTKEGDKVKITYDKSTKSVIPIATFDNENFTLK